MEDEEVLLDYEERILAILRKTPGEIVSYWTPMKKIADVLLDHRPGVKVVPKAVREAKRAEIAVGMTRLIAAKKVIRYCHPKNGQKAGVRISEAYV
jgi:hypothetical protein